MELENIKRLPADLTGKTGMGQCKVCAPQAITIDTPLDEILVFARRKKATDIHITVDNSIFFKLAGVLKPQTAKPTGKEQVKKIINTILSPDQQILFEAKKDMELIYVLEGAGRFRVTMFQKNPGWDITIRLIPMELSAFEDSGMSASCRELINWTQGMVLITGPAGCGKTTTLSILCEILNQTRSDHIITLESPIEFIFTAKKARITQREIKLHTISEETALRAALRQDPDIIIISELRDPSMIQLAATAAETGHLVLGTMNTNDAAQTILRLVNSFPHTDRSLIQNMISESLHGIICERLLPRKDGLGVVPAYETLIVNSAVANLIRKGNIEQIVQIITTGSAEGMLPMDKYLMKLLKSGIISWETADQECANKRDFEKFRHLRFK